MAEPAYDYIAFCEDMIERVMADIREAEQQYAELDAATTRVTNSHEPARGVNTQRGHGRLKGEGDG